MFSLNGTLKKSGLIRRWETKQFIGMALALFHIQLRLFDCLCFCASEQNLNTNLVCPRGGVLGSSFAGYVPLASQNPYPIIVYSVANYRPHLSHYWANVIVISSSEFNVSRLLNY